MGEHVDLNGATKLAVDIILAYLGPGERSIEPERLPELVKSVRHALTVAPDASVALPVSLPPSPAPELENRSTEVVAETIKVRRPAVPIQDSVHPDYLVSLEDGKHYRSLRRHLMAKHGLTPDQYRERWGLPSDYPMVAPSYARARSEVAKQTGLGRSHLRTETEAPRRQRNDAKAETAARKRPSARSRRSV